MTVLVLVGAFILNTYGEDLAEIAFVPDVEFEEQIQLEDSIYADIDMWMAHPQKKTKNPALWLPQGFEEPDSKIADEDKAAVFFVHPTSFLKKDTGTPASLHWIGGLRNPSPSGTRTDFSKLCESGGLSEMSGAPVLTWRLVGCIGNMQAA